MAITGPSLTASFQYDAVGRRKQKTVNGTSTDYLYDGLSLVQELSGGSPQANLLVGVGIDEVLSRTDGAGAQAFLADGLGSTLALTDSVGTVQTEYTYEPFGQTTISGTASTNAFQYTGRENDGTGLYYYRARYYHPTLQRFISEDPIGFNGGDVNLYGYVGNDPVNLFDPDGLAEEHSEGARESTRGKHEAGQRRQKMDYGGEKGDTKRGWPRKRPKGYKGPWPPPTGGTLCLGPVIIILTPAICEAAPELCEPQCPPDPEKCI